MIARFIFAETVYDYEHSAPHFVTRDLQLPDGFVPPCSMGRHRTLPLKDGQKFPDSETYYPPMDLKGVELIDRQEETGHGGT